VVAGSGRAVAQVEVVERCRQAECTVNEWQVAQVPLGPEMGCVCQRQAGKVHLSAAWYIKQPSRA